MSNAIYKVVVNNNTIVDLSDTSAVANDVTIGKTIHLADGSLATGTDSRPSYVSAKKITQSGAYTAEEGTAWSTVVVEIPYQQRTVTPSTDGQEVKPLEGYEALSKVVVNPIPNSYIQPFGTTVIDKNGIYDVKQFEQASVNVPIPPEPILRKITIQPSQNAQEIKAEDYWVDGFNVVAMPAIGEGFIKIPTETLEIDGNGSYDVTNYAKVVVNVSSSEVEYYDSSDFLADAGGAS